MKNSDEYDKNCGLSEYEWELEQIVDKIKSTESTLDCINILKNNESNKGILTVIFQIWLRIMIVIVMGFTIPHVPIILRAILITVIFGIGIDIIRIQWLWIKEWIKRN